MRQAGRVGEPVRLDGVVALVTGASGAIGSAVARELGAAGATVAAQYCHNQAAADATVGALPPGRHCSLAADLTDPEQVRALVDDVAGRLGRIDVLVNVAGIHRPHPVLGTSFDDWQAAWRATLETNLLGPANLIHQVVPHMVAAGGGRIVNISSRGAFRGEPDHPAYGASKAGLNNLAGSMARALAPYGIYVTTIAPGLMDTDTADPPLTAEELRTRAASPLSRAGDPAEIARLVVFLATPGTEYLTGAILDLNGASYLRM
jgi:NAD(P)-dependent dehydrogenase (short-subunit alcohol dehydrogenase family)